MLDSLELFFGDANAAETRIYARLPIMPSNDSSGDTSASLALQGTVVGPFCQYSQTLTATVPLLPVRSPAGTAAAAGTRTGSLLAEAIIPDACFWTTDLPFLYRVSITLLDGTRTIAQAERTMGIRPLGARGSRLVYEGHPWVLRAASTDADIAEIPQWHDAALAMVIASPTADICQAASEQGVLLVADLSALAPDAVHSWLQQHAHWPAIGLLLLPHGYAWQDTFRQQARNAIWIERFRADAAQDAPSKSTLSAAPWADAICIEAASPETIVRLARGSPLPVIARSPVDEYLPALELRKRCDQLQRALAGKKEFAGYLV